MKDFLNILEGYSVTCYHKRAKREIKNQISDFLMDGHPLDNHIFCESKFSQPLIWSWLIWYFSLW